MNQQLSDEYLGLTELRKEDLRRQLRDSPRALSLLDFLEKKQGTPFQNRDAVKAVYAGEKDSDAVLQNRFFKLRKKIIELIREAPEAGEELMLPIERDFFECRRLVEICNYKQALTNLRRLYETCKAQNVFEWLPNIVQLMIYSSKALYDMPAIESFIALQEEANQLLDAHRKLVLAGEKAYHLCMSKNYETARPLLRSMQQLAQRYEKFPRFLMNYHLVSVMLGPSGYGNEPHAVSRQIRALAQYLEKYPDIPLMVYEHNANEIARSYLSHARCTLAFLRGDTEEAYEQIQLTWNILNSRPGMRFRITDSVYANRMLVAMATSRYQEAIAITDEWLLFHKGQHKEEQRLRVYSEAAHVYVQAFPQLRCPDPEFYIAKIIAWTRLAKKQGMDWYYKNSMRTLAAFSFFYGDPKAAVRIMKKEDLRGTPEEPEIFTQIYAIIHRSNTEELKQLLRDIDKWQHSASQAVYAHGYALMRKVVNHALTLKKK